MGSKKPWVCNIIACLRGESESDWMGGWMDGWMDVGSGCRENESVIERNGVSRDNVKIDSFHPARLP